MKPHDLTSLARNGRASIDLVAMIVVAAFVVGTTACDGGFSLNPADYVPHPEICNNGIDDDKNGDIDCDDVACATAKVCQLPKQHGLEGEGSVGEGEGAVGEGEGAVGEGEGAVGEGEGEGEGTAGEGEGEGATFVVTEVEPNDTPGVDFDVYAAPFTGRIAGNGDDDCVSLDLGDSERVDLHTTNGVDATCGIDTVIDAFDTDGVTQVGRDDDGGGGTCSLLQFRAPHAGTFYFCVHAFSFPDAFNYGLDVTFPPAVCGDGTREFPELCDASDFGNDSCSSLGFASGALVCNGTCDAVDTSQCAPAVCQNGVAEGFEECDGFDFRNDSCVARGFENGPLTCTASCTVDTSSCPFCGDGVVDGGEQCEGSDLQGFDCTTFGFQSGPLLCNGACAFDTTQCVPFVCGDDIRNGSETCDGVDVQGLDCTSFGFQSGTLQCTTDCTNFDTSQCVPFVCGDNVRNGSETCDGPDLGGATCQSAGFGSGTLACSADCFSLDTSGCNPCGNGRLDAGEECDDGNFNNGDLCSSTCTLEIAPTTEIEPNQSLPVTAFDGFGGGNFSSSAVNQTFTADAIVNASFDQVGDEDGFGIQNTSGSDVVVHLQTFAPSVGECNFDTVLVLRDVNGVQLALNDDDFREGSGRCSTLDVTVPAGTTLYAHVSAFGDGSTVGQYELVINFP